MNIKRSKVQMTKINAAELDLVNMYRSQGADDKQIIEDLETVIDIDKITIIVGDVNFCFIDDRNHPIAKYLEANGFSQHVKQATHLQGGHIDQVYSNLNPTIYDVNILMHSPYYTYQDHDALFVTLKKFKDKKVFIF